MARPEGTSPDLWRYGHPAASHIVSTTSLPSAERCARGRDQVRRRLGRRLWPADRKERRRAQRGRPDHAHRPADRRVLRRARPHAGCHRRVHVGRGQAARPADQGRGGAAVRGDRPRAGHREVRGLRRPDRVHHPPAELTEAVVYIAEDQPAADEKPAGPVTLPAPSGQNQPPPAGADGADLAGQHSSSFDYLSRLARDLGVPDPVEEYFAPVVGRRSDMEAEADRWRQVGDGTAIVTDALKEPLGKLDAAWDGEAATSFIGYMQKVGLAGVDLSDAMLALADVLDTTAEGIREIVQQMGGVLADTAQTASQAMAMPVQGDERTRTYLDAMRRPTKELFEAVRQVLEAFVQMCEGIDGSEAFRQINMAHTVPEENWSFESDTTPDTKVPVNPKTRAE